MMKARGAGVRWGTFALSVAAAFAASPGVKARAAASIEKPMIVEALFVSDIHFEPFWDPAKAARLKAAPVSEWSAILAEPSSADQAARFAELQKTCGARATDTPYLLYDSSLQAIHNDARGAKFIVLSGDLISHDFSCVFKTIFPTDGRAEYRAFVEKTIDYVIRSLRGALPGVPVYAALGNNDSDCGDYELDPDSAFLADSGKVLLADFPAGERAEALKTFGEGGFYSARLPLPLRRVRMLVLDDLFMSQRYTACSGKQNPAPAAAQIAWLEQQLDAARRSHEKVWVTSHIPPGVNPYATATKVLDLCSGGNPQMFLSSEALPEAMARYGDVITLAIFAHTHMDEMRMLEPEVGASAQGVALKMVPSISPINGNNPTFTVAEIDARTGELKDYQVFVGSNQTGIDTEWSEEYDFAKAYKEPAFTAATAADLIAGFKADPTAKDPASQSYIRYYSAGGGLRALGTFWQPYTCAFRNDGADAFRECVCRGK
ncbi:MAG: metallophosphoesterase [Terracidiphilus sp.]|jgi:sphingomyelin phosphodiesterase acid-like 3